MSQLRLLKRVSIQQNNGPPYPHLLKCPLLLSKEYLQESRNRSLIIISLEFDCEI